MVCCLSRHSTSSFCRSVISIFLFFYSISNSYSYSLSSSFYSSGSPRFRLIVSSQIRPTTISLFLQLSSPTASLISFKRSPASRIYGISMIQSVCVACDRSLCLRRPFSFFLMSSSILSEGTIFYATNFYLKNYKNFSFFKFYCRLLAARLFLFCGFQKTPPMPCSLEYMKLIMARRMVLMFQLELQVSLWQCVKEVQMDLPTSNLPLLVRKLILGGEKGQSSGSSSSP